MSRLAILAALWCPLVIASCLRTQIVRVPYAVTPAPCLDELPPDPPATEDDAAWSRYHVALEAWAAYAVRACGSHLDPVDEPAAAGHYGG